MSNLLNNAIEAITDTGIVNIKLSISRQYINLSITDNGIGMDEATLDKVLVEQASISKEKGSGIGLTSTRAVIKAWHGQFSITSNKGEGTTVTVRLLKATAPNWFAPVINLPKSLTAIVVLDDDSSIHSVWAERFTALKLKLNRYDFFHVVWMSWNH